MNVLAADFDCQACGACCAYSSSWPRFSLESDERLDAIPPNLVAPDESGMRCVGDRCAALDGRIGRATACAIYDLRPDVCRDCQPGDEACLTARRRHGLPCIEDDGLRARRARVDPVAGTA